VGFGSGARELTKKTEEQDVGTRAVLVHAKDRSPGLRLWTLHGGGEVAADGRSGRPWRARGRTARRKNRAGLKQRMTRGRGEAGGGRRRSAQRRPVTPRKFT
jgi:hypothetical protein